MDIKRDFCAQGDRNPFEVSMDGRPLVFPTRNAQPLFAYLVLNGGKVQRRERLAGDA